MGEPAASLPPPLSPQKACAVSGRSFRALLCGISGLLCGLLPGGFVFSAPESTGITSPPDNKVAPWLPAWLALDGVLDPAGRPSVDRDRPLLAILPSEDGRGLEIPADRLAECGAEVVRRTPDLVLARVPLGTLRCVASEPSVGFVRPPLRPRLFKIAANQGTRAQAWQEAGIFGAGVKVGVIDVEYRGYRDTFSELGLTEYRTWVADSVAFGSVGDSHGVACVEVLHSVAPAASFHLAQVGFDTFEADFPAALDWLAEQGVSIVSASLGISGWYHDDGSSPLSRAVDTAREKGLLVCMAAGNEGERFFWADEFVDENEDGLHEFLEGDSGNDFTIGPLSVGVIALTWDGGQRTGDDYDLLLHESGQTQPFAGSTTRQTGTQPPLEAIIFMSPEVALLLGFPELPWPYEAVVLGQGDYELRIRSVNAGASRKLRLFMDIYDMETLQQVSPQYASQERSIATPADARGALAVGAVGMPDWDAGKTADYSSRGPTSDGRLKPDLVAPSALNTLTYAPTLFEGTSAAAPVCAGAAALVLSRKPGLAADALQEILEVTAVDVGMNGPDNVSGAGKLTLPSPERLDSLFLRGDVDSNGMVNLTDIVTFLDHLFLGTEALPCLDAGDVDDDGLLHVTDGVVILQHLFLGGEPIDPPTAGCGLDATEDSLTCEGYTACR